MQNHQFLIQTFDEFNNIGKKVKYNWERFHSDGETSADLRSIIASSWERCKQYGINPLMKQAPLIFQEDTLYEKREQNRLMLDVVLPTVENLFSDNSNIAWFITDPEGIILEGKIPSAYRKKVGDIQYIPGADISEKACGTNATALALIEKTTVQVFSAENTLQSFHPYVGCAAPIRDSFSQQILGVLNIGGDHNVVQAHDIYLLHYAIKSIDQTIGSFVREQNIPTLEAMFDMIQEPLILYDINGIIIRYNEAAKYVLRVQAGENLTKMFDLPYSSDEWKEILTKGIQCIIKRKEGFEWKVQCQPYKIGKKVLGGMAIFQKKSFSLPTRQQNRKRTKYQFSDILTLDSGMQRVIQLAKKAAFSDKTLLITGETGTGKELLAQSIHTYGSRQQGPFIEINCGAIPKELIASELFGYEGGSFTGARTQGKKGKFLLADQGTIFLDEIGDLPLDVQVYLLRVLEERAVIPVGGSEPIPINIRVIAATHKNLEQEMKKGNFREDLYHRLNVISFTLPSLRDRRADIPLLVNYFVNHCRESDIPPVIENAVMEALCAYSWPGNIRQLKNIIEKMIFHADDEIIRFNDLPHQIQSFMRYFHIESKRLNEDREDKDRPKQAIAAVYDWAVANNTKFFNGRESGRVEPNNGWMGIWYDGIAWTHIDFSPEKLEEFLTKQGYQARNIIKTWANLGWLITKEEGGKTRYKVRSSIELNERTKHRPRLYRLKREALEQEEG